MENNSNFRLNGLNPLAYMGVNPRTPVPFFSRPQDPTPTDYANFILGTIWLNTANENIWMLVKKANFVSTWVQFSSGSSGTVISLTGDDSIPVLPLLGNINVLAHATSGSSVTFTGATANTLKLNVTDALANTIIGNSAGNTSISGDNNTALGFSALNALTLGSDNTAIGESSLAAVLTGSNNIAIGQLSGDNYIGAESSNILIGNLGTAAESNTIRIGTQGSGAGQQNRAFIAGIAGVTVSNENLVTINTATGQLGSIANSGLATTFDGNTGSATPSGGILNIVGDGTTATTAASGNTITITAIGGGGFTSINRQVFTTTGTYTPTTGMLYCDIEVIGGGGGGASSQSAGANSLSVGASAGGGGYARGIFSAATIGASKSVTIGSGGAGSPSGSSPGATGGTTSVGTLISATGGASGGSTSGSSNSLGAPGGTGGIGTGGDFQTHGSPGGYGSAVWVTTTNYFMYTGNGGSTFFGGGALGVTDKSSGATVGNNATSYGGGGGGSTCAQITGSAAGGNGFAGIVIVTEYI
jgi:hypothetical protein